MPSSKHAISFVLSFCLFSLQVLPGYFSYFAKNEVRVAYIGTHFQDIEQDHQQSIDARISSLIERQDGFSYITREEIENRLDVSLINEIKRNLKKEDFLKAAKLLNVDYVFAGNMENQSKNRETSALVGNIARYDLPSDNFYNLKIQSFFEDFNQELIKINNQLVQTIVPEQKKSFFKRYLPGFIIAAATVLAIGLLLGNTDGQGSGGNGGPKSPFTDRW